MKTIDRYIIRKFLGTFFFTLIVLIFIVIIFDISEKIDDFLNHDTPLSEIIFDYYLNFIPYFVNLFSYLLTFIAVIFFTSQMASMKRDRGHPQQRHQLSQDAFPLRFFGNGSSASCRSFSPILSSPIPTGAMLEFENKYVRNEKTSSDMNVHKQISPGTFIYLENFNLNTKTGYKFSLEQFSNRELTFKLMADKITYDSVNDRWKLDHYFYRTIDSLDEVPVKGRVMDTVLAHQTQGFRGRHRGGEDHGLYAAQGAYFQEAAQGRSGCAGLPG
ncbi:MAG: LptF/LptG family permease [Sphingobacterium sp.]|nr:LptF/LptG family permease [Sphingobacterium sp.]